MSGPVFLFYFYGKELIYSTNDPHIYPTKKVIHNLSKNKFRSSWNNLCTFFFVNSQFLSIFKQIINNI